MKGVWGLCKKPVQEGQYPQFEWIIIQIVYLNMLYSPVPNINPNQRHIQGQAQNLNIKKIFPGYMDKVFALFLYKSLQSWISRSTTDHIVMLDAQKVSTQNAFDSSRSGAY